METNKLEEIYSLVAENQINAALDIVFREFDRLFCQGCFSTCDNILDAVDLEKLDINLVIGFLSVTWCAREKLSRRKEFVIRSIRRLSVLDPDRIDRLMDGLK